MGSATMTATPLGAEEVKQIVWANRKKGKVNTCINYIYI
jgi:hypothetical protein